VQNTNDKITYSLGYTQNFELGITPTKRVKAIVVCVGVFQIVKVRNISS